MMLIGALALAVSAPSFDCAKARTNVETLICGDEQLKRADQAVATTYRTALRKKPGTTRREQREWVADRDRCATAHCLVESYESRLFDTLRISGLGRRYNDELGVLLILPLGKDWYAFSVLRTYVRRPSVAYRAWTSDAWASGVFRLVGGKAERRSMSNGDAGWSVTRLPRNVWRIRCLPDLTSCGGLNATIDGDYR